MRTIDSRIDAYMEKSADFSKPILHHLRKTIHKACPNVVETIKWGFPHFLYQGSILCSMASFKQHCAFGFWLSSLMEDPDSILFSGDDRPSMGHLGQIKSIKDLPTEKVLMKYIKQAMVLIDNGAKLIRKAPPLEKKLVLPGYFTKALQRNKMALSAFNTFSYAHQKEYVEWVEEAKTEPTRDKRVNQTIIWLTEGKSRNWKYMQDKAGGFDSERRIKDQ